MNAAGTDILLQAMNEIVPIFLNVPDDEMYNEVLKILLKTTKSRHGFIAYIEENGAMVAPSMTKDIWEECQIPGKTYIFPRETWGGTWGRALIEKRPVMSNAGDNTPKGHIQIERSVCVPLVHFDEIVGLFEVAWIGVPDNEKEIIFDRGYGLYIAREILELTNIAVRERGISGKGARFEILVPKGAYRRP